MTRVCAVYNPESNTAKLVSLDGRREVFGQYMALLASGLEDRRQASRVTDRVVGDELEVIPHAKELFHFSNTEKVHEALVGSLREHHLTASAVLSELALLAEFRGSIDLFNAEGLAYDSNIQLMLEEPDISYGPESMEAKLAEGLGLDISARAVAYIPETGAVVSKLDEEHVSLGTMVGDQYVPVITVFNERHPLRQRIEAGLADS